MDTTLRRYKSKLRFKTNDPAEEPINAYWLNRGEPHKLRDKPVKTKKLSKKERKRLKRQNKQKKSIEEDWIRRVKRNWKDTPEQAAFRRSPEYQQWRVLVLERDKYTCQHCEKTGGGLVVHHVKSFKMYPELRLEPDNGIVLCNDCHEKLHLNRVKKPKILRINSA